MNAKVAFAYLCQFSTDPAEILLLYNISGCYFYGSITICDIKSYSTLSSFLANGHRAQVDNASMVFPERCF